MKESLLKYSIFGIILSLSASYLQAQDPVDCSSAIAVCNSEQLNYNSNGPGINDFGPGPNDQSNGCLAGDEHQSAWFQLYISPSSPPNATLAFTLTPLGGAGQDYDFALYGPNVDCSDLGDPIRCSFAAGNCGFCPETGLGMGTTDFSEGASGDGFVAEVETQPGQSYILLIDNWSSSNIGFFLDWTGTAILSCSCTTIPAITGDLEICDNETTVLTATGTNLNGYLWAASGGGNISGPTNTSSINATSPGTYTVTVSDTEGCSGSVSVVVLEAPSPEISSSVEPASCAQSNGSIDLTITGGSGPFSFDWSNGAETEDVSGLPSGSYAVTVTNSNGCTSSMIIQIPEDSPELLVTGVIENNTECVGGNGSISTTVTPPGMYTYLWSNGNATADITDLIAGIYILTVTSVGSCTGTAIFTVLDEPDLPEINSSTTPSLCDLANGEIDITVLNGAPPYDYSWSGGETTEDLVDLESGSYFLTVTGSNGCSATLEILLTNNNPLISITASIAPNTSCNNLNGSITTTINPPVPPAGVPYIFSWSNGSTVQNLTGLAPGTYTLTVSGGGSCTQEATFTVPDAPILPSVTASITPSNCGLDNGSIQTNVSGGIPPFTYLWSNGSTGIAINSLFAGNYSVTVTGGNGCTATASYSVPDEPINFVVTSVVEPNTACNGDDNGSISVNVVPAGNYAYSWSNGGNGPTIADLADGTYSLTISAGGTCEQILSFVVPYEPGFPLFIFDITSSTCGEPDGGATVIVTGGEGPFTYQWSTGATTQDMQNVIAGNYTVTVTGANTCAASATVTIPNEMIDIVISELITSSTSCLTGNGAIDVTVTPSSGLTFQWSNGESVEDINNLAPGSYALTVSAGGICEEVFSFIVPDDITIPVINLSAVSATCEQENGSIDLTMSAGQAPFDYAWSNGEAGEDLTGLFPGTYTVTVTDALGCMSTSAATVNNNTIPIDISGFAWPNTTCEIANGEIDISVIPTGNYTYLWSNGEDTEDLADLGPGTYYVTVTLGTCNDIASFTVGNETSTPIVEANIVSAICNEDNGSIDLTVSGSETPYTFIWSTGEIVEDITDLFPGNYMVTVTGSNDCSSVLSINVPNNSSSFTITGTVMPLTNCLLENGSVDLEIDPPGSYEILWSNGETTEDLTNLPSGDYTVTVTQSGSCSGSATFSIEDDTSIPSYNAVINFDECNLGIGSIELTNISGIAPFTLLWSNGENIPLIDNLISGNYTVTVTDNNGCTATSNHLVASNNIDISITGSSLPNTQCANPNGSIDITVSPPGAYTYLWSNGNLTEDLNGIASGNYTVTVSSGSCMATAAYFVGADASTISLNTTISNVSCFGGNDGYIDLELGGGQPPFIINWNPPVAGSPEDLTDLAAGGYAVTVTDQAGCAITSNFTISQPEIILLTCHQKSSVSVPGGSDGIGSVQIGGGTPPYSLTWVPGGSQTGLPAGTFDLPNLIEGDYAVEVMDANGCVSNCNFSITSEDCSTMVGVMDPQPFIICGVGCVTAAYDNSTEVLNPGDIVQFFLHEGSGNQIQNEIARADQPQFCFDNSFMQFNLQYYISAIAGPDDGTGNVLMSGPCDQTSPGTPVIFREVPVASINEPGQIDCDHPEMQLTGQSTIPSSAFAWSTRNGNIISDPASATIIINKGGLYELIVSSNTCKDTTGVIVEQSDDFPELVTESAGSLNCKDSIVILSGYSPQPGVDLIWVTITNGDTATIGMGGSLIVNTPGTYHLLGIGDNGCTSSASLTVNEMISNPSVNAGEDILLSCDQTPQSITANASGGVEFLWIPPAGVQLPISDLSSIHVDQPGVYIVLVTDTVSFCTSSDSVEVMLNQDAPVSNVLIENVTCHGEADGSILVQPEQGDAPFTFLFNGSDHGSNNEISSLGPGMFTIEVIDAGGCAWITVVEIEEPELLILDLGADMTVHPGEMITMEAQTNIFSDEVATIDWTPGQMMNCLDDPCMSIRFSAHETTEIEATLTDINGCVARDAVMVFIIDDENVFVPNIFSPNGDGKNDVFTVNAGSGVRMIRRLSVFSRWGELLYDRENLAPNDLSAGWDGTYRGSFLNPGVYTWKAEIEYQDGKTERLFGDVTVVK